jgi:hypothetical protein
MAPHHIGPASSVRHLGHESSSELRFMGDRTAQTAKQRQIYTQTDAGTIDNYCSHRIRGEIAFRAGLHAA